MEADSTQPIPEDDPASAFAALRSEVSLLRRAIEGLTAERQNAPDYTPTLAALFSKLAHVEEVLGQVSESPAMDLTPDNLAASIARASETVRVGDRETLEKAGATLRASIASINGIVEHAWAADRQWRQLYWTGGVGLVLGATGALSIQHLIG